MTVPVSNRAHVAALVLHMGLMLGLIVWSSSLLALGLTLVLLAPLRGMVAGNPRTFGWASMLLTFYCAALLADAYARPALQAWSLSLAGVAALEFVSLVIFVRLRSREFRMSRVPPAQTAA